MKKSILVVGEFMWPWYQQAFCESFSKLDYKVTKYSWSNFFWDRDDKGDLISKSIYHKIQYKFLVGPIITKLNKELINQIEVENPQIVFFYNCQHISHKTFELLKSYKSLKIIQYFNDDPFSKNQTSFLWRHAKKSIRYSDLNFVFRKKNISDFASAGSKLTKVLLPYYCKKHHYPILRKAVSKEFKCDVVFAGHYENDGRLEFFEELVKSNYNLKLYGGGWNKILLNRKTSPLFSFYPIKPAIGENYIKAICGSKIALCFYSKINSDSYTSRNFEIPAMNRFLLTESSDELKEIFKDDEIVFFNSFNDLKDKIDYYLINEKSRIKIENNAYNRVLTGNHEVLDRVIEIDNFIKEIK
jgi:hypothetical protein